MEVLEQERKEEVKKIEKEKQDKDEKLKRYNIKTTTNLNLSSFLYCR
ncbi:hypothetical protein BJV85_002227 [Clostridium acetobutylicum]|nr:MULTISPECIES: hypothetical protein [Clostridium]MBC2394187.1 hypothetical protein [Clostridium acetobutylicum]MBC2584757.1 hypothetical protein [Clostridium acetobutylicum]NOV90596.1 hypothetical protein [Clostridium acetobutylicum]NOW14877.1 hypothetical protein [Clostridium acetobutylicum]NRY56559.1 hypothetical protein [Clostridium acetobutylicum]